MEVVYLINYLLLTPYKIIYLKIRILAHLRIFLRSLVWIKKISKILFNNKFLNNYYGICIIKKTVNFVL